MNRSDDDGSVGDGGDRRVATVRWVSESDPIGYNKREASMAKR